MDEDLPQLPKIVPLVTVNPLEVKEEKSFKVQQKLPEKIGQTTRDPLKSLLGNKPKDKSP